MQPDEVIVGKTRLMIHGNPPVNGYLTVVIPYSNDYGQTYTKWPVIYKIVKLVPLPTTITLTVNDNDKMVGHGENFSATVQVLDQWGQPMILLHQSIHYFLSILKQQFHRLCLKDQNSEFQWNIKHIEFHKFELYWTKIRESNPNCLNSSKYKRFKDDENR
jgi:hypothetical protein